MLKSSFANINKRTTSWRASSDVGSVVPSDEKALTGGVANAIVENKARYLQTKLNDNLGLIDQLRRERDVLAENHNDLQRQFARASEVCPSGFFSGAGAD